MVHLDKKIERVMGCQVPVAPAWHRPERSGDRTRGFDSHHPEIIHLDKKIERVMGCQVPVAPAWHRPERSGDRTRGFDSHHPEIIHLNKKNRAGDGNRTHVSSLEG